MKYVRHTGHNSALIKTGKAHESGFFEKVKFEKTSFLRMDNFVRFSKMRHEISTYIHYTLGLKINFSSESDHIELI